MSDFTDLERLHSSLIWDNFPDGGESSIQPEGCEVSNMLYNLDSSNSTAIPIASPNITLDATRHFAIPDIAIRNHTFPTNYLENLNDIQDHWSQIPIYNRQSTHESFPAVVEHDFYNPIVSQNLIAPFNDIPHDNVAQQVPSTSSSGPFMDSYTPYAIWNQAYIAPSNFLFSSVRPEPQVNEYDYHAGLEPVPCKLNTQLNHKTSISKNATSQPKKSAPSDRSGLIRKKTTPSCVSCRFQGVRCEFEPGSRICSRCIFGMNKIVTPSVHLSVPEIIVIDTMHTQIFLAKIRAAIETAACARGIIPSDTITLYLDDPKFFNHYQDRPQPIVLDKLSTTAGATESAKGEKVPPALQRNQLNKFVDGQIYRALGSRLYLANKGIVQRAQRCAAFLAMLYNIDCSRVYEASDTSIEETQSFVLETLYSIVYEIQELIQSFKVELAAPYRSPVDYVRALCALFLLYRSINSHCKLSWTESHLVDINEFLTEFHERTSYALPIIKGAKVSLGASCCIIEHSESPELKELIEKQPKFIPFITATFEKNNMHCISESNISQAFGPSLIQILEVGIKHGDLRDVWIDGKIANQWEQEQLSLLPNWEKWIPSNNRRKSNNTKNSSRKKRRISTQSPSQTAGIISRSAPAFDSSCFPTQGIEYITNVESDPSSLKSQQYMVDEDIITSSFIAKVNENFQWPTISSNPMASMGAWTYTSGESVMRMRSVVDDLQYGDAMPRLDLAQELDRISNLLDS